jgi:hypothetical protein
VKPVDGGRDRVTEGAVCDPDRVGRSLVILLTIPSTCAPMKCCHRSAGVTLMVNRSGAAQIASRRWPLSVEVATTASGPGEPLSKFAAARSGWDMPWAVSGRMR